MGGGGRGFGAETVETFLAPFLVGLFLGSVGPGRLIGFVEFFIFLVHFFILEKYYRLKKKLAKLTHGGRGKPSWITAVWRWLQAAVSHCSTCNRRGPL
jgi:hypothetical protein